MTDRRPLLRAIFDAAVAAAHPDVVLAPHLRPVPKGNVICLAAGKGAAAIAAAALPAARQITRPFGIGRRCAESTTSGWAAATAASKISRRRGRLSVIVSRDQASRD